MFSFKKATGANENVFVLKTFQDFLKIIPICENLYEKCLLTEKSR